MNKNLIKMLRKLKSKFELSNDIYYHSILLFHVWNLKKINKKDEKIDFVDCLSSKIQNKDKIEILVCLFLAMKFRSYELLNFSHFMEFLEIEKRFETAILKLEVEILKLLRYRLENLLPSNETIFAGLTWDSFIENISQSCVDIKFGIKEFLNEKKESEIINSSKISEFDIETETNSIESKKNLKVLTENIDIIAHNEAIYELYMKKSSEKGPENIHPMKKIGLAILYVTIIQESSMIFSKKFKEKGKIGRLGNSKFIDFVFNDFLASEYRIDLDKINDEIFICLQILQDTK